MGVYAGPDVSESGLVFALDGANYKSFKGEATTNEIVSVTWSGDGSAQSGMSFGSSAVTEEYLKYNGYETYLWSPGTSLNCYLNGADVSVSRTSTVWTFSCYVKREDGAAITSLSVYMYYPNSDGSAAGTIENVGNGWYRVRRTRTGTNNYISLAGFTGFTAGYKYYLSGAQLEKKSYATTVVATNTTRGTTVATGGGWADLTGRGNNGVLQNGVRESSDNLGALVFDGGDEYVSIANSSSLNPSSSISVSTWIKFSSSINSTRQMIAEKHTSPNAGWWFAVQSNKIVWLIVGTSGGEKYIDMTNNTTINANVIYNIVGTYDGSTGIIKVYVNGNDDGGTVLGSGTGLSNSSNPLHIGAQINWNPNYSSENIYSLNMYNRALTATEIQQNFNANRSRFGI